MFAGKTALLKRLCSTCTRTLVVFGHFYKEFLFAFLHVEFLSECVYFKRKGFVHLGCDLFYFRVDPPQTGSHTTILLCGNGGKSTE